NFVFFCIFFRQKGEAGLSEGITNGGRAGSRGFFGLRCIFNCRVGAGRVYAVGTMRQLLLLAAGCICACAGVGCAPAAATASTSATPPATVTKPPTGFTKTIVLWPNGAPGALGNGDGDVPRMFVY